MTARRGHGAHLLPKRLRRGASPRGLPGPVVIYRSRRRRARAAGTSGGPQRLRTGPAGLRGRAWGISGAKTDLKNQSGSGARGSPAGQGQPPALGPPDPLVPRAPPPGGWRTLPSAHPRPGLQGRSRAPAAPGGKRMAAANPSPVSCAKSKVGVGEIQQVAAHEIASALLLLQRRRRRARPFPVAAAAPSRRCSTDGYGHRCALRDRVFKSRARPDWRGSPSVPNATTNPA